MAEPRWVDWDGLVYYDGKVKTYIDSKLADCIKCGGRVTFENLPPPSFENLNYIYKITDDFVSNDYFEISDYKYESGTVVKVTDFDDVYLYTIFNEVDSIQPPSDPESDLSELTNRITIVEDAIQDLEGSVDSNTTKIDTIDTQLDQLETQIGQTTSIVSALEDRIDIQAGTLEALSDSVDAVEENIGELENEIHNITTTYVSEIELSEKDYVTKTTVNQVVTEQVNTVVAEEIESRVTTVIQEKMDSGELVVSTDAITYGEF